MADVTGRRDRPNAGPLNSAQITMHGIATNYYWYQNDTTGKYEIVKSMPPGEHDQVVKEFATMRDLQNWVNLG
jgi:hypothetical protein